MREEELWRIQHQEPWRNLMTGIAKESRIGGIRSVSDDLNMSGEGGEKNKLGFLST